MSDSIRTLITRRFLPDMSQDYSLVEKEEFNRLYLSTHLSVFRYTLSLLGGPIQDAEDITSKTYLRAWGSRNSFSGDEESALRWLLKIARNLIVDATRHKKVREKHDHLTTANDDALNRPTERKIILNEQQASIWKLIQALPDQDKEIVTLRYFLDFPIKEIAAQLDVPQNTLSVRLRRIMERLRRQFKDANDEE